jgi:hypothetical protein
VICLVTKRKHRRRISSLAYSSGRKRCALQKDRSAAIPGVRIKELFKRLFERDLPILGNQRVFQEAVVIVIREIGAIVTPAAFFACQRRAGDQ